MMMLCSNFTFSQQSGKEERYISGCICDTFASPIWKGGQLYISVVSVILSHLLYGMGAVISLSCICGTVSSPRWNGGSYISQLYLWFFHIPYMEWGQLYLSVVSVVLSHPLYGMGAVISLSCICGSFTSPIWNGGSYISQLYL